MPRCSSAQWVEAIATCASVVALIFVSLLIFRLESQRRAREDTSEERRRWLHIVLHWDGKRSLRGTTLERADLYEVELPGADLRGANLEGALLDLADLSAADLTDANLQGARLMGTKLESAKLPGADLRGADLWAANLQWTDLWAADLRGADLGQALIEGTRLMKARVDEKTKWPDGFVPPDPVLWLKKQPRLLIWWRRLRRR